MKKEKYGLFTAISMVVGIVIGSGIFFKADDILIAVGGSLPKALFALMIGGLIMLFGAYTMSLVASKAVNSNGILDYVELGYGKKITYYVGIFISLIYYPSLVTILSYVTASYTISLFGISGNYVWLVAVIYMVFSFLLNFISPVIAGYFQVSTMIIKLIPVFLVGVVGLVYGLSSDTLITNITSPGVTSGGLGFSFAILSTAFFI